MHRSLDDSIQSPGDVRLFMLGNSVLMHGMASALAHLADTDANLLIQGEPGTGKRVLAEAIHAHSTRATGPFLVLSLASLADARVDEMLFGKSDEPGLVDTGCGGTLYLDAIERLSVRLQRRLVQTLASPHVRDAVRVIAGTGVAPEDLLRYGRLRADLYYQLAVIRLTIPPLRERREDVAAIANEFVARWCERRGVAPIVIGRGALAELLEYSWPGNARELQDTLEAALETARGGELGAERVRAVLGRRPQRSVGADVFPLRQLERDYIATVLSRCNWNQSLAARRLGIGRNTLMRKIKSFRLARADAAA